jgi:hypothetical protein
MTIIYGLFEQNDLYLVINHRTVNLIKREGQVDVQRQLA